VRSQSILQTHAEVARVFGRFASVVAALDQPPEAVCRRLFRALLFTHDPSLVVAGLAEMEFRELSRFDDGHAGVFWSAAGGPSPWEMHPDCDEMLQVLEGEIEFEVLPAEGARASRHV
jgi:mannose-6-phosphate isomerase-like protein (cupin superfamily)